MLHWILDVVGAVFLTSAGHFFGWHSGWKHGYREGWENETESKQDAKAFIRQPDQIASLVGKNNLQL
jgi:hypothetical protein